VDRLQDAARKHSRYGHRDATAILIAYRHGLRASELCELTWNMIELDSGRIHVRRAKNGVDSTHPLTGKEIRALRQLRRENLQSRFVFNTERGGPVTRPWFLKMVRRTGELAKLPFPVHPHMLRHACGFKLANDGVDTRALQHFLGHRNIMHTVRYTEQRSDRFDGLRERISDETDATGERRVGNWHALPLAAPERPQQPSGIRCKISNLASRQYVPRYPPSYAHVLARPGPP
jgi:type 1 fimbriae regulatory protein FimB/type 1 fimbriae regulatory protein FimE